MLAPSASTRTRVTSWPTSTRWVCAGRRELALAPGAAGRHQQRGADRAAEVAQLGELHPRRAIVDEQVRHHRLADALHVGFAETGAEAAADHHGLHARAQRAERALDQLGGQLVAVLEGTGPDPGGEPRAAALLHDLEEVRLAPALVQAPGADLHPPAPGVSLHAAAAAAGALRTVDLDHHVAQLSGRPTALPRIPVEHQPAADAGAPPDPEQRLRPSAGAEHVLRVDADGHVVVHVRARVREGPEAGRDRDRRSLAGQVARFGDDAAASV